MDTSNVYPYLLCEERGRIIGCAYAHCRMQREAYQWNVWLSIYIDEDFTSKGIGTKLYSIIIKILKLQCIKAVYAGVTTPNKKSERFHFKNWNIS